MSPYVRIAKFKASTVLNAFERGAKCITVPNQANVSLGGKRLRTFFETGFCCVSCGLEATFFAAEKHKGQNTQRYHLNLYGLKDGQEVLFTHDHTLARALGGSDTLDNMKTMCSPCNNKKARIESKLVDQKREDERKRLIAA